MAKLGTSKHDLNQSPTGRAYNWGTRGVEVTTTLLRNWLGAHTENSLLLRYDNLKRRVSGPGATLQRPVRPTFTSTTFAAGAMPR